MKAETILQHLSEDRDGHHGAVVPPIYQNSLFTFKDVAAIDDAFSNIHDSYIYARGNNPTVVSVEEKLAALEGGDKAKLFTSGMAAISASLMHCLDSGDHVICVDSAYGPTQRFIQTYLAPKFKVQYTFVSGTVASIEAAILPNTKVIYLESPSSGIFAVQDLAAVATLAKEHGVTTMIDNTWATPIFQNPLAHGIDVVIHSVSKYISGHSDVVAGVVISNKSFIDSLFEKEFLLIGGKVAPFEAWLILRGMRTLPVRIRQHSESAQRVMAYLRTQPKVSQVLYPGYESQDATEIVAKQMRGGTGLFSFQMEGTYEQVVQWINTLKVFEIGISWGGFESLVYAPIISLSKEMTPERLAASGIHPGIIRLSIGLENVEDLIDDLEQAFSQVFQEGQ